MVPVDHGGQITDISINGLTGGVDSAVEDLAQSCHTGGAGTGSQDDCTDGVILVHPTQFHGVVRVDDNDHIFKAGADQFHQILLGVGQFQIVLAFLKLIVVIGVSDESAGGVAVVGLDVLQNRVCICQVVGTVDDCLHIRGQVGVLAAASADDDDRGIGEGGGIGHDLIGVEGHVGLRQRPVLVIHGNGRALGIIVGVESAQALIGGVARIVQRGDDIHHLACGTAVIGRTGAAVDGVHGCPAKDIQAVHIGLQGQQAIILHQNHALVADLLDNRQRVTCHIISDFNGSTIEESRQGIVHGAVADHIYDQ